MQIEANQLTIDGWGIMTEGEPSRARFLINGKNFDQVNYSIPSPDIGEIFWNISGAQNARFLCRTTIDWQETFKDGFACLEFLPNEGAQSSARQKAWYLPKPNGGLSLPEDARISRVIGVADSTSYLLGGAAIFKRFEQYIEQQFSLHFSDFEKILDWRCGSGRVLRHFNRVQGPEILGVDIDGDNMAWCNAHLPHAKFSEIPLTPPTLLPNDYFDLIIGISVLTHLNEERAHE